MSAGFCDRCSHMLGDRAQTQHATVEECIEALRGESRFWQERAESEHRWVHKLEDEIARLRREAVAA